jgi:hypothetical protein
MIRNGELQCVSSMRRQSALLSALSMDCHKSIVSWNEGIIQFQLS